MTRPALYFLAAVGAGFLLVFAPLGVLAFRMELEHRRMAGEGRTYRRGKAEGERDLRDWHDALMRMPR